ncbi:hypothetical protein BACCAP_03743 [Pseudoflavonifractor capillosus ATCC 29799]|uniref:Uncharacterized protein n=1 Tax=Pseudoflavonifractor capillosus ATCC 29799 TaxID=411467 RepID=A6NZT9_9FIRM|nr:hypothetical protein BACCAP_03743 [Pseudoflavonifractor capillosus ATCC 29799]
MGQLLFPLGGLRKKILYGTLNPTKLPQFQRKNPFIFPVISC